jgi:carbon starvation protein CstA
MAAHLAVTLAPHHQIVGDELHSTPRLIFGEQLITLVMDVGECLAAMVAQQLRALCWTRFGFDYRGPIAIVIGTRLR